MSKEKRPPEEGKEDSKGYVEIDLSGLKEKLDDGYERLVFGHRSRKFDGAYKKGEGRLGLDPIYAKASVVCVFLCLLILLCGAVFGADGGLLIFFGFMLLLCGLSLVITLYEIRFDGDGFSTRFGKRVIRSYRWSEVTDVRDNRKVYVNGKPLLTDHTFEGFPEFYKIARAACKGKGKATVPSEKKQRNRKKAGK